MLRHDLTRRSFLKVRGTVGPALTQRNRTLNHVTFGGAGMAGHRHRVPDLGQAT